MSRIGIVTDSSASIPDNLLNSLNIYWVPYYIHRGKEVLRDLVTIKRNQFYRWLPTAKVLPKTASPGPGDYLTMYEKLAANGIKEIISIHMTSKGSSAYQAAIAAKSILNENNPSIAIDVIDTLNVSMCHGWMVIEAARSAMKGASRAEIIRKIKSMIPVTQMYQTADTLKYLFLGGRIGKAKHLLGSLLNIKPIIGMKDGIIVPLGQARSRNKVYTTMVKMLEQAVGSMGKIKIAYVHADAYTEAMKLKQMVEKRIDCVESIVAELSPALGVHTGPGTVGLCFFPLSHAKP